jgi:autotransporter-associated beta strand protein
LHGRGTSLARFHFPNGLHFEGLTIANDFHDTRNLSFQSTNLFQDGTAHTINHHLTLIGPQTLAANTGALAFGGNVTNGGLLSLTGDASLTLNGIIAGSGGLAKSGSGIVTLSGASTYGGATTISNGTLLVNGSISSSAVSVRAGAILGGSGFIGSVVNVASGGTLSPGASLGTLTIRNNLVVAGNLFIEVNKSPAPTNDRVVVSGILTNAGAGTLTVANTGATALTAGDRFVLYNKPMLNRQVLTITPASGSGQGCAWTNQLAVDGSIEVTSTITPPSPIIGVKRADHGAASLNWPAAAGFFTLYTATNLAPAGLETCHQRTGSFQRPLARATPRRDEWITVLPAANTMKCVAQVWLVAFLFAGSFAVDAPRAAPPNPDVPTPPRNPTNRNR